MPETTVYDLVVIGGGPAGYAAAIRAGQLSKKVACIERERAGGTCLNWGCIPTKTLLKSAELYRSLQKAATFGIGAKEVSFDFTKVMDRSRSVAAQMSKGVEFLLRKNKVDYFVGRAQVAAPDTVEIIEGEHQGKIFKTRRVLIATGCKPSRLPGVPVDGTRVMTSREALAPRLSPPQSIAILGAGAIGVEFAYFFNSFGAKVTLIEMLPQIVPLEDEDVARTLQRSFERQGITVFANTKAERVLVGDRSVKITLRKSGETAPMEIEAETLLLAIGVAPNLDGVLAPSLKLELDRGYVLVNDNYESSVPGIYAAGDIIGPPWLAHVATFEAVNAVQAMFGHAHAGRAINFPGCIYCQPQIASVGLTERTLKERKLDYKVGKFPFSASGKAVAAGETEGFVKVISDAKTSEIYGAHILGNEAPELIAEYVLAMNLKAGVVDVHHSIHAHPSLSEALMEAAAATSGEAIHI